MKNILLSILCAGLLSACSGINEQERYIETESVLPVRAVLIEDFTGQNCVNCPQAHATIERLIEQYGDAVIPVSIHAGQFGIPVDNKRYTGLMQPEGDTYNDAWGIIEWPKGVVDRRGGAANHDEWSKLVRDELSIPAPVAIDAEASLSDDIINISLEFRPTADIEGMLQVWIIESGIIARQEDIDRGRINDYVHNNVYRASVNGIGGQSIRLSDNIHSTVELSIPLRTEPTETWVPENLKVVAFIYNGDGVLQAASTPVACPGCDSGEAE